MYYFVSILVLHNHLEEEEKAGCFAIIVLQMTFFGSSSRCSGLVCSVIVNVVSSLSLNSVNQ